MVTNFRAIEIPGRPGEVTAQQVISLEHALGFPDVPGGWCLAPLDSLIPTGTPVVRWYQHALAPGGVRVQVLKYPAWTDSIVPHEKTPEVFFIPSDCLELKLEPYKLPVASPGRLVEVVLVDGSIGVLARGAEWRFTPNTTTEHYAEGISYLCADGKEFIDFMREEVLKWDDLRNVDTHINPKLKGSLNEIDL